MGLLAGAGTGCVSDRYIGSIGPTGSYSNRGYGVSLPLSHESLAARWKAVDPRVVAGGPSSLELTVVEDPVDINGDGILHIDETTRRVEPMLRLVSRTSTGTWIDVTVRILGGPLATRPLPELMADAFHSVAGRLGKRQEWESRKLGPDFEALVAEVSPPSRDVTRVAVIDHADFIAEDEVERRQLIRVVLYSPPLTAELRADYNRVLDAVVLNARGAPLTILEQW